MPLDEPQEGYCNARLRGPNKGRYCAQRPIRGTGRCKMHGGMSLRGAEHPSWKTGRWAKSAGKFREAYQEARADDALLDVRRTLATLDVAVQRAWKRVNDLDTPDYRAKALAIYREVRDAAAEGDTDLAGRLLGQLGQHLGRGVAEDVAFANLVSAADTMARRLEAAWSLKLKGEQVATRQEIMETLSRMIDVVLRIAPKDVATKVIETARSEIFGADENGLRLQEGSEDGGEVPEG